MRRRIKTYVTQFELQVTADNRANCAHPIEWLVKWVLTKIDSIAAS